VVCAADLEHATSADHNHFTRLQRSRGIMGPNQKALLAVLDKRFAVQERRFNGLEQKLDSTTAKLDSTAAKLDSTAASSSSRLDALESVAKVFDEWRPSVNGVIDDLRIEVNKLSTLKLEVGKISKYMESSLVDGLLATQGCSRPHPVPSPPRLPCRPTPRSPTRSPSSAPTSSRLASATSRLPHAHLWDLQPLGPVGTASKSGTGKVNLE
jgi:hypothetical protein